MDQLIDIKPVDSAFYRERISRFLPERVIDIHTHIWLASHVTGSATAAARTAAWPARVAAESPVEDLLETYRLMLPGKRATPLLFASPTVSDDLGALNEYVSESARRHNLPALALTHPGWGAAEFEDRIGQAGFRGAKVYHTFAPAHLADPDITIFDFLPRHHLAVLDRRRWLVVLHLPRPGRLGDPVNLDHLAAIDRDYPNAAVIVAHVGRAYCPEDVGRGFDVISKTTRLYFDISANTNEEVFRRLIGAVGPRRIIFGSDLPVTRMRTRRICEHGRYVNLVPRGLYGDVSGDRHMRELDSPEADRLTFFLYEEIAAFRRAAEAEGLTGADIGDVFYANAARLLDRAAGRCCVL